MDRNKLLENVSLIIPTYNCFHQLEKHLEHLKPILKYFGQILAVDSYSEDGTYELLKEKLEQCNAKIYQRGRGLYASWNDAISKASCEYCYISTVGDLPDLEKLSEFFGLAISSKADISISPPNVIKENIPELWFNDWPIHKIIRQFNISDSIVLEKELFNELNTYCALNDCFASLSGSLASNLSQTQILQDNPFPTTFEGTGDVIWCARISLKYKVLIHPHPVSTFILHEKSYNSLSIDQANNFVHEIIKTLKLNHDEITVYKMLAKKVLKNKELMRKYKFFRLFMPIRYINKYNSRKLFKQVKEIIDRQKLELAVKLLNAKKVDII